MDAGVIRLGVQVEGTAAATRSTDGSLRGYLPEIGHRIARGLGVRAEFVTVPRGDMLGLSQQRAFDLGLGGAIASTWLAMTALLSDPIMRFHLVVLTPHDRPVSGMGELATWRVGILDGRSFAEALREAGVEEARTVTYRSWEQAAVALTRGGEEAVIVPNYHAREIQRVVPRATMRFTLGEFWHCAMLRMGEHDLLRAVNVLLHLLRQEGQLPALHRAFFEQDPGGRRTL
nr:transporter substrate-binding domain-containing protein [Roseococcus sp. SDR]